MSTTAILLAGGSGTRLGTGDNKAYLELGGHPLLTWSLAAFERCPLIDDVVLVTRAEDHDRASAAAARIGATKLRRVVTGGESRHASEQAGLDAIAARIGSGAVTLVAIHDAARPFVSDALLERLLVTAAAHGGSVPALPVGSPLLIRVTRDERDSARPVTGASRVDGATLRRMQTPQAFRATELLAAYRKATTAGFDGVDTADTVGRYGTLRIVTVAGDPENRKVTYAEDLTAATARALTWPGRPGG